jgi:hypothetical protein
MSALPLLLNHDHNNPIGTVEPIGDGKLEFKFNTDVLITKEMLFDIFGNAGLVVTHREMKDGVVHIKAGEILEFSFCADR